MGNLLKRCLLIGGNIVTLWSNVFKTNKSIAKTGVDQVLARLNKVFHQTESNFIQGLFLIVACKATCEQHHIVGSNEKGREMKTLPVCTVT
jgi:hypothetical protein